ncbi:unnamed protein product [Diatraea saccharalis]|uniref:EGF-like domain-containing protein n=1 Tax=Diatraea saccharalis TaxID=40085 RepID=A0A9N9R7T7_9NEOP|nr:unnamed protein product [Diatraea saccharalis]
MFARARHALITVQLRAPIFLGDGAKMTMQWFLPALLALSALVAAEPRYPQSTHRPRHWQRGIRTLDDRSPSQFVGPHVCRSRNSTHCCPGWTSRPNSLLCVVPLCRPDCGSPEFCIAPNMCRCPNGIEAPSCNSGGLHPYSPRTRGGCRRICMNGGTCTNGTCACAPGWSGEFCTEPICREPCLHGGRCIAPDRCVCFHGLSGTRCEIDRRTGPCYTDTRGALCTGALEGVVCTKQLCCATVGVAWGHPCERCADLDCPPGHLRNLATKECQDIDECAAVPGLCSGGKCVNSIGSFACECPPGQRRHRLTNNCEDIDECEEPDICPNGKCVNTEGDYYCHCNPHFIPSPDKKFCIDGRVGSCFTYISETGECSDRLSVQLSNRDCCCGFNMGRAWGELCAPCPPRGSMEWSHLCGGIPNKWRRNNTGGIEEGSIEEYEPPSIAKINECMLRSGICGLGDCVDKDPGYNCNCWEGAEKNERDGNPICIDIDECALGYCKGGICTNNFGSFDCRCPPGFDPVDNNRRCSDQNECEVTHGAMCTNGLCRGTATGYECVCNPGYESTETGHACRDVDECRESANVCRRGRCRNLPGSYDCQCDVGFEFVPGSYCIDIDECADKSVCKGGRCVNIEGSFQCVCEAGYRLTADRGACVDVDECSEQRVCRNGRCHNTPGSFRCECLPGFTLSADGRTCLDEVQDLCYEKYEDGQCSGPGNSPVTRSQCCCSSSKGEYWWRVVCMLNFILFLITLFIYSTSLGLHLGWGVSCKQCPSRGSPDYEILCPEGQSKDNGGADINECNVIPGICQHGTCENLDPGFRCICDPGFHSDSDGICRDIDECDMHQSLCTGGTCRNTIGSFTCVCPPGTRYEPDEQICRDIDECDGEVIFIVSDYERGDIPPSFPVNAEQSNPCDNGRCINTHGSYECECEHGFVLDATAQHCIDNRRGSCWRRVVDGQCEGAAPRPLLRQECCCSVGLAWGSPCEPCDLEHCPCPKGFAKAIVAWTLVTKCAIQSTWAVDARARCGQCCAPSVAALPSATPGGTRAVNPALRKALSNSYDLHPSGTDAFRNLCMLGTVDGPFGTWDRPWDGSGNMTDIWDHMRPIGPHDGGGGPDDDGSWPGTGWPPGTNTDNNVVPKEMDVNECSAFPGLCGHGRCRNMMGTFVCDCFPGYEPDSKNHTCVDVNECEIVSDVCGAGECRNNEGSFSCHCRPGHRADEISKVCVALYYERYFLKMNSDDEMDDGFLDINECVEDRGLCRGGRCVNTPGSFRCECAPGMELAPDRFSCKDIDECSITSGICSNGACENQMGTYQCVCDEGYAQLTVKSHCEDIDECAEDPTRCQHDCVNTPGSYHCNGRTCRDVDECGSGARPCGGGECRNTPGGYSCVCGEGLLPVEGDRPTCRDIDECADIRELCGAGQCQNTIGSFVCRCPDGYSVKPEQGPACTDDDECELGTCDCHPAADCINLPGSFQCRCRDGWRGDGSECEDVDECVTNNGGCHPRATCRNTDGSFVCLCDTGYKGDGYSCVDIDECANDPTLCENGHCSNTPGGYVCDCDVGFTKTPDEKACLDMDECATFDNVCVFGRCVNTYGMFKCICDKGYQSDNVDELMPGFNCTDVDECKSPQSCQYGECINTQGSYICRCPPNYELVSDGTACYDSRKARCYGNVDLRSGTERCHDRDELSEDGTMAACCCSVGAAWGNYCDLCPEPGTEEYRQLCPGGPGYQPVLEPPSYVVTLADIDECEQHPALCEHGTCTNTFGSFVCTCGDGWALSEDEQRCVDIDECAVPEVCGPGVCRNMPGSYVCLCPEGYVPMPSNKECVDIRQRQCYLEWDEETGKCSNAAGAPQTRHVCCCSAGRAWGAPCERCPAPGAPDHVALCGARPGQYINPVTNETRHINECEIMPQLCKPGTCHDTASGFTCGCDHG